jgi:hypothetical protein
MIVINKFIKQLNHAFDPNHPCEDGQPLCSTEHPTDNGLMSNTFNNLVSPTESALEDACLCFFNNNKDNFNIEDNIRCINNYNINYVPDTIVKNIYVSTNLQFMIMRSIEKIKSYTFNIYIADHLWSSYWFVTTQHHSMDGPINWRDIFGSRA